MKIKVGDCFYSGCYYIIISRIYPDKVETWSKGAFMVPNFWHRERVPISEILQGRSPIAPFPVFKKAPPSKKKEIIADFLKWRMGN